MIFLFSVYLTFRTNIKLFIKSLVSVHICNIFTINYDYKTDKVKWMCDIVPLNNVHRLNYEIIPSQRFKTWIPLPSSDK